jgi:DNA-3-methyladenine glycosylase II
MKQWSIQSKKAVDWSAAERALSAADPVLRRLIRRVGKCTIVPRRDYFNLLCISIFNQQISIKIAAILYDRFCDQFPLRRPTPAKVAAFLTANPEVARKCGISRQKHGYLLDLSQHFINGTIPVRKLRHMSDEQVIETLTRVKGIGRWTAEMFLIFVLNRPDVFPIDDLGLQEAVKQAYGLKERPKPKELIPYGDRWKPWRSVATWYLWKGTEEVRRPDEKTKGSKRIAPKPKRPRHGLKARVTA